MGMMQMMFGGKTLKVTGGTITDIPGYRVHTFTGDGQLVVEGASSTFSIEYLVVAGGGGSNGSTDNEGAGGGGAGGLLYSASTRVSNGTYTVSVGAGGPEGGFQNPGNGSSSVISGISSTAIGGGGASFQGAGAFGGSGGGGNGFNESRPGGSGVAGQGNSGGFGPNLCGGGGGGGHSGPGGSGSNPFGGFAGAGTAYSITGTQIYYACGGPGQGRFFSSPGSATLGGSSVGQNGAANRGNGAGGSQNTFPGTRGGSGIVIIRYRR